jgi:hypothetical protein
MTPVKKRLISLAITAVVGAFAGWLTLNLVLDMLLGGKLFG